MTITYQYHNTSCCTCQYHNSYHILNHISICCTVRHQCCKWQSVKHQRNATTGKGNMPWLVDCCQHATANTNSTRPPGTSAVHHATTASNHKVLSRIQEHLNQATNQLQNIRNGQATFNKFTNHIVTTTRKHPVQ